MDNGFRCPVEGEAMDELVRIPSPASDVKVFATRVRSHEPRDVPLAHPAELATFATTKRRDEHLTGRWLLGQALMAQGEADLSLLEIVRTPQRAPSLAYIQGVWRRTPLPSVSIAHSEGMAFVALGPEHLRIGVDAEPLGRNLATNAFDLMAKGHELDRLLENPDLAMRLWTGKEAVQKALGLGMHLNPREIEIPIEENSCHISIGKSKIQLDYCQEIGYHVSLATTPSPASTPTAEDRLLEETKAAMEANPDWGVGCNTQRNRA